MATCERCEDRYDRIREGTPDDDGRVLCADCRDELEEAAYERRHGGGGMTIQERFDADVRQRMELRRHD